MKSIDLVFDNNGEVKSEAIGFKGKGCEAAAKFIEQALGLVKSRSYKAEYHHSEAVITPRPKLRT
jgi:hypothetical protein